MNQDLIFNLRIFGLYFQVGKKWKIVPMFAWFDFWIGLFFDVKSKKIYLFPIPMIGIKSEGIWVSYPKSKTRKLPAIWLIQYGNRNYPMFDYHGTGNKNNWFKLNKAYNNSTPTNNQHGK